MRTVAVTGGSRGIGAAIVRAFARQGDRVHFLYEKNKDAAMAVAAETGAIAYQADVSDSKQIAAVFRQIGPVDLLINNAGIASYGLFQQLSDEDWHRVFAVCVDGAFYCTRAVLPGMLQKQAGCIINISSMWGQVGSACEVCYSAAKGALISMTKALAKELGPSGIRVNCVAPGVILTDMAAALQPGVLEALAEETPLGRNGTPEEVAQAVCALADNSFITGQVLPINGGFVIV